MVLLLHPYFFCTMRLSASLKDKCIDHLFLRKLIRVLCSCVKALYIYTLAGTFLYLFLCIVTSISRLYTIISVISTPLFIYFFYICACVFYAKLLNSVPFPKQPPNHMVSFPSAFVVVSQGCTSFIFLVFYGLFTLYRTYFTLFLHFF